MKKLFLMLSSLFLYTLAQATAVALCPDADNDGSTLGLSTVTWSNAFPKKITFPDGTVMTSTATSGGGGDMYQATQGLAIANSTASLQGQITGLQNSTTNYANFTNVVNSTTSLQNQVTGLSNSTTGYAGFTAVITATTSLQNQLGYIPTTYANLTNVINSTTSLQTAVTGLQNSTTYYAIWLNVMNSTTSLQTAINNVQYSTYTLNSVLASTNTFSAYQKFGQISVTSMTITGGNVVMYDTSTWSLGSAIAATAQTCSGNANSASSCSGNASTASNLANGTYAYGSGGVIVNANTANSVPASGIVSGTMGSSVLCSSVTAGVIFGQNNGTYGQAGFVGEISSAIVTIGINAGATGTWISFATMSLTSGDWLIYAVGVSSGNGANFTAGNDFECRICSTTAGTSQATNNNYLWFDWQKTSPAATGSALYSDTASPLMVKHVSQKGTVSWYVLGKAVYSSGTPMWYGNIWAERIR